MDGDDTDDDDIQIPVVDNEMKNFQCDQINNDYDFLYPDIDDPHFNIKIAEKKKFKDIQYDGIFYRFFLEMTIVSKCILI